MNILKSFFYFKTYIQFFTIIAETNVTALIISIICVTILLVIRIHINERFQKKLPIPIPTELFIVSSSSFQIMFHVNILSVKLIS